MKLSLLLPILASLSLACRAVGTAPPVGRPLEGEGEGEGLVTTMARTSIHLVEHAEDSCALCAVYERVRAATFVVRAGESLGTAVLLAPNGSAITNAHVVGDAQRVQVMRDDGSSLVATVVARDVSEDLALLRIAGLPAGMPSADLALSVPRIGSEVYAIGHPLGLGWSVSRGIVSGLPLLGTRPMIQTDAAISPGNSGGPLVDGRGNVIGIVTEKVAVAGAENLAFARPIETVVAFLRTSGIEIEQVPFTPEPGS